MLSAARKLLGAALAIVIRSVNNFNSSQQGCWGETRTEKTTVPNTACVKSLLITAAFDFEAAYDKVRKQKVMQELWKALPAPSIKMGTLPLQPLLVRTKEDYSKCWAAISDIVRQGSALSSSFLNVCWDSYPRWISGEVPQPETKKLSHKRMGCRLVSRWCEYRGEQLGETERFTKGIRRLEKHVRNEVGRSKVSHSHENEHIAENATICPRKWRDTWDQVSGEACTEGIGLPKSVE